jgi:ribonuclease HI
MLLKANLLFLKTMNDKIEIFTDGACLGNPGAGGFAWILLFDNKRVEHSESEAKTTNNRMELSAVVSVLSYFDGNKKSDKKYKLVINTDSNLIVQAVTAGWLEFWAKNNWIKQDRKPVKNQDLWGKIYFLLNKYDVDFAWIKGHSGIEMNELCDKLARQAATLQTATYHQVINLKKKTEQGSGKINTKSDKTNDAFKFHLIDKEQLLIEQIIQEGFIKNPNSIVLTNSNINEFQNKLNQFINKYFKNDNGENEKLQSK